MDLLCSVNQSPSWKREVDFFLGYLISGLESAGELVSYLVLHTEVSMLVHSRTGRPKSRTVFVVHSYHSSKQLMNMLDFSYRQ